MGRFPVSSFCGRIAGIAPQSSGGVPLPEEDIGHKKTAGNCCQPFHCDSDEARLGLDHRGWLDRNVFDDIHWQRTHFDSCIAADGVNRFLSFLHGVFASLAFVA